MLPALVSGIHLTIIPGVGFTNRVANNQGPFLSGCVTEWGKAVSDMKQAVVNHGRLFRATLPSNRHPTTLTTRLLSGRVVRVVQESKQEVQSLTLSNRLALLLKWRIYMS